MQLLLLGAMWKCRSMLVKALRAGAFSGGEVVIDGPLADVCI